MTVRWEPIKVNLIDSMGSDLSVVNAARVSFDKFHEEFESPKDDRLIKFLAREGHWSPFAHTSATFKITAPIFVARQLVKHQVGLAWNEVSRRYVDNDPTFHMPEFWRARAADKKQGSDEERKINAGFEAFRQHTEHSLEFYNGLLKMGVAPEQARMVLPLHSNTEWYWTGSVYAFARVCNLRLPSDAQKETRQVAVLLDSYLARLYPVSWEALVSYPRASSSQLGVG